MIFARIVPMTVVTGLITGLVVGAVLTTGSAAEARAPKPVITSVQQARGSSVGYAHLIIRGHHLKGGKVTVAGRRAYAKVISSTVISAFPAGHHDGKRFAVVVRTKAGTSNHKSYEYRYARRPGTLRTSAASAVPGGAVAALSYTITRCPAVGTCVSLGSDDNADGLVARITTRGHTTVGRIPVPADYSADGTAALADLSCPTATYCAAVGSYNASSAGLISIWNGATWTSRATPVPTTGDDPLHDLGHVSCASAGHCLALDEDNVYALDNATIGVRLGPAPAGYAHVRVAQVSCPAAGWCALVGSGDVGKTTRNFVAVRTGTVWTTRALANPPKWKRKSAPDISGFDCAHVDRCTLVAGGRDRDPLEFAALHSGSARWAKAPLPADAQKSAAWAIDAGNTRVECPTSNTCWALAAYEVSGLAGKRGYQPVALRLHDGKVRVFALPRPASSKTGRFVMFDISCPSASSCVAVGDRGDADVNNIHGDAIVETYAAGVWTPAAAPSPAGRPTYSGYEFTSVDCSAVASCTAVGDYNYAHNPDAEDGQPLQRSRPVVFDMAPR